ncbi:MAG: von Willebrand factor type A domain-containing protein, partial [Proteiniphilum sp.]|nr:von Willebrand factor type A domain-containing protein [Proteiniphilum sp.]
MKATKQRVSFILITTLLAVSAYAQEIEVSGKVFDEQKQPVIGVTIRVKGTGEGTVSDMNGEYRIKTRKGETLVFMFIGYVTREIKVKEARLDVYMKPVLKMLEEVVVVAFGSQKRESIIGSAAERVIRVNDWSHRPPMYPPFQQDENSEEYEAFGENRFLSATKNPLSTFSLDVDAASYGNIRRLINQGQLPQKDAVRVEEMINYFSYNYPQPTDGHPVRIITETALCPWN